jgi:hypothetical protein
MTSKPRHNKKPLFLWETQWTYDLEMVYRTQFMVVLGRVCYDCLPYYTIEIHGMWDLVSGYLTLFWFVSIYE